MKPPIALGTLLGRWWMSLAAVAAVLAAWCFIIGADRFVVLIVVCFFIVATLAHKCVASSWRQRYGVWHRMRLHLSKAPEDCSSLSKDVSSSRALDLRRALERLAEQDGNCAQIFIGNPPSVNYAISADGKQALAAVDHLRDSLPRDAVAA